MNNFSYIAKTAKIGNNCIFGYNVVVLDNVKIGDNSYIGNNAVIHEEVIVGENAYIEDNAVLGRVPRSGASVRRKPPKSLKPLQIGNDFVMGVGSIVYRGVNIGNKCMLGDLASVRENVVMGGGVVIGRLVMVEPNTRIGSGSRIQTGSHITGNAIIEENVFFGDEVSTANDNTMGRGKMECVGPHIKKNVRVGSNATILPGIIIGENAAIGAGSVVTKDVPAYGLAMGVPARLAGWMCECGNKLGFENDFGQCKDCLRIYKRENNSVTEKK